MRIGKQGFLAELLGYSQEASTEVGGRRGVLWEEGSQSQQTRGIPQTLKVFRILREPCAEHCTHRSAERRREMLKVEVTLPFLPDTLGDVAPNFVDHNVRNRIIFCFLVSTSREFRVLRTKRFLKVLQVHQVTRNYLVKIKRIIFKSIIRFHCEPMKAGVTDLHLFLV